MCYNLYPKKANRYTYPEVFSWQIPNKFLNQPR